MADPSRVPFGRNTQLALLLVFLAVASALVLLPRIDGSLRGWDEALYAEQAREILVTGDWLTPRWNFRPWFEKPPLVLWLTALAYLVAGQTAVTARSVSALFGIGTVLLTFLLGRTVQSPRVGLIAAAILLSLPQFQTMSRQAMLDLPVTFFSTWAALALWSGYRRKRFSSQVGIAVGLGVLAKGFPVILPLVAAFIFFAVTEPRLLRERSLWKALAISLLVNLPWHLAMVVMHGQHFLDKYFFRNILARATTALEGNSGDALYYVSVLSSGLGGYAFIALVALLWLFLRAWKERRPGDCFVLVQVATVFVTFSLVQTKLPWYVVPLLPCLALCVAAMFESYLSREVDVLAHVGVISGVAVIVFNWSASTTATASWSLTIAALVGTAILLLDLRLRGVLGRATRFTAPISVLVVVGFMLIQFRMPERQDIEPGARLVGECLKRLARPQHRVIAVGVDKPGLIYYAERQVEEIPSPDQLPSHGSGMDPVFLACSAGACEDLIGSDWKLVFTTDFARLLTNDPHAESCEPPAEG